jgi:type IV pilus assembly protein PilW
MTMIASHRTAPRQRGFSLIEILIGLLIAMVAVVIMMEVLITSEQRTRTTSGGNEALSTGAVMLHLMQRDLVQSGYGINTLKLLGCNLTLPNGKTVPMAPVVIYKASDTSTVVPQADADTDRLLVFYGNDTGQPEGNTIYTVTGSTYTVQAPTAFNVDDYVIAHPDSCGANLKLAKVTAVTATDLTVNDAQAGATTLYNMGKAPKVIAYAVRNGSLASCDYMAADCSSTSAANWTAVGGNIVSLRAQYGHDTTAGAMDGTVDAWDQTTPTNSCGWVRSSTVRYALVARGTQYESKIDATGQRTCDAITTAAPAWNGSADVAVNLSTAADWQCYRYRTFENVAPSRNIVWMGAQAGC